MSDEEIKKDTVFLDELTIRLRQRQIHCSRDEEFLIATMEGHPVARVDVNGDIYQRKTDLDNAICLIVSLYEALFHIMQTQKAQLESFSINLDISTMQICYQLLRDFVKDKYQKLEIDVDNTFKYNYKNGM